MPSVYDMDEKDDIYRATVEYDYEPMEWVRNPNNPHGQMIRKPTGPVETKSKMVGPYTSIRPIKAWVTRNRNSYYKNLRLVKIEKVSGWEEVDI